MSEYGYKVHSYGSASELYYFDTGFDWDEDDACLLAEECAQDYYDHHDGWESKWPLDIEVFRNNESLGLFTVEQDIEPVFSVSKKETPND